MTDCTSVFQCLAASDISSRGRRNSNCRVVSMNIGPPKTLLKLAANLRFSITLSQRIFCSSTFGLGKRAFARLVTEVMDARRSKLFPGPFCSWLVAECYNGIGWDIFAGEPNRLSPGALDKSKRAREIDGWMLDGELVALRPLVFQQYQQHMRFSLVMGQNNINEVMASAIIAKGFSDFNDHMKNLGNRFEEITEKPVPEQIAREQAEIDVRFRKQSSNFSTNGGRSDLTDIYECSHIN